MSSIAVIGTGYVGLTTGVCFAHLGHDVVCADVVPDKIERLSRGESTILEAGLDDLLREGLKEGRLRFVLGAANAVSDAEFVYLCVPTPQGLDGSADMSYIEAAASEISPVLRADTVVVNKSTVPVGSTRLVERALGRSDVAVVSNPEFLREGSAIGDFLKPDRVVIGSDDQSAAIRVASLYIGVRAPLMVTDPASAETIKYASNAFLATKLSFVNAVAAVCEAVGADVNDVVLGMGYDRRIGSEFLRPGPGWGGSCFPKDTRAMLRIARDGGYDFNLLQGVLVVNDEQFERTADKVQAMAGGSVAGKTIAVWGLTFKAGTDDLRESPSLEIIRRLVARGACIRAYDPAVAALPDEVAGAAGSGQVAGAAGSGQVVGAAGSGMGSVDVVEDAYAACEGADVLTVLTEWDEFKWLDFDKVAEVMAAKRVVDGRNLLDRNALLRRGFTYQGIGRA